MKEQIELMADYGCHPLWEVGPGRSGDINPAKLPLKPETIERLERWASIYDALFNQEDPAASGFPSDQARNDFDCEGINLWDQLRSELEPDYKVHYFSERLGKHLTHPSELEATTIQTHLKDAEALTLKAFLAALSQQRSPISDKVKAKLGEIAQSLETRVMDLHDLAIATPTLETPYKNARLCLASTAAERSKGPLPADDSEDDDNDNKETDNITRDSRSAIEEMKRVLATIDSKFNQAARVLSAPDPVQAAQQEFN